MAKSDTFKITYIGGGSRFVVTLLHGLASKAPELKALGRPIELALLDLNPDRANDMARYAQITAKQSGLALTPTVTADRPAALKNADLVIFSVGMPEPIQKAREMFESPGLQPHGEHSAGVAIEAAALWPYLKGLAADIKKHAPKATFATLVNPTDVMAGAFQEAFDIPSIGMCVEVGGLVGWLSYYLDVPESKIHLDHIGANHVGWVSQWAIDGVADPNAFFWEKIPRRMELPDWYAHPIFFVKLFKATGHMRSSPYHNWPFKTVWDEAIQKQQDRWAATCLPPGKKKGEHRVDALQKALADGQMIPDFNGTKVHPEATPYTYPNTRHTLGAVTLGLAGGKSGPVSLQIQNDQSNPHLPQEAWIEVPTRIEAGKFIGKTIKPIPEWLFNDTTTIILQRMAIIDWLAGKDEQGLAKGLLAMPQVGNVNDLLKVAEQLHKVRDGQA